MSNRSPAFTAERLLQILTAFPPVNRYVVGFSGGADSTALVHAIGTIRERLHAPLSAVHVNHGIHPDADTWQRQCEAFCRRHQLDLTCLKVELANVKGKGLEAEARHLRYEAISSLIGPSDCLLTAHHADDQAETLLLNLMRGSGVDGLTGMPENRPFGNGYLQRPLLHFKNSALRDYLNENSIDWAEDPSNQFLNHDRNFVRHALIPMMEQRWPGVSQRLLLTQDAMADARHLLERVADKYLAPNLVHPFVLQITAACGAEPELFRLVIRRWLRQSQVPVIPVYKLGEFCDQVKAAGSTSKVAVSWDGWLLRWYKSLLWLQKDTPVQPCPVLEWQEDENELDLGKDVGRISIEDGKHTVGQTQMIAGIPLKGQFRVSGRNTIEDAVIEQGGCHKSLKKLFQTDAIPPWLRNSIPICTLDGEIMAVGDWCLSERFANRLSEHGSSLYWRPRHPLLQFIHGQKHKVKY